MVEFNFITGYEYDTYAIGILMISNSKDALRTLKDALNSDNLTESEKQRLIMIFKFRWGEE